MSLASHYSETSLIECGCDEAGRGCLAGPLFAAAVILPYDYKNTKINDSKQLSEKVREKLREEIIKDAIAFAVVEISAQTIDSINILQASIKGMNDAVLQLATKPELLLIDGNRFHTQTGIPYHCIVKGDGKFISIAAASILAKTFRDDYMRNLDQAYPQYNWKSNKGYPTEEHQNAIFQHGRTIHHRKSFQLKSQLKLIFP